MSGRRRITISKRPGARAGATIITDADTGEPLNDVIAYTLAAHVTDKHVTATLRCYERRVGDDGLIPEYECTAEVVELDTDAIEGGDIA